MAETDTLCFSVVNRVSGAETMSTLRQLFAHSDDAGRPLAVARPRHQVLEVEWLWIPARLSLAPNVSVTGLPCPTLPTPIQSKPLPLPRNYRFRLYDDQR